MRQTREQQRNGGMEREQRAREEQKKNKRQKPQEVAVVGEERGAGDDPRVEIGMRGAEESAAAMSAAGEGGREGHSQ